jgi:hypothetical protein
MKNLPEIPLDPNLRFVSFDIEKMYSNIPTDDLIKIIKSMSLEQSHNEKLINELINIAHTILEQNYFNFQNSFYVQKTGLAMGAHTS